MCTHHVQLFMWQRDIVGPAHALRIVLMCLVPLKMLLRMHQPYLHQPWRLDRSTPFITMECRAFDSDFASLSGGLSNHSVQSIRYGYACTSAPPLCERPCVHFTKF